MCNLTDYAALGQRVRRRREALELTQAALAARCGVSVSFIGHLERAEKIPSLETTVRLAEALALTLDALVLGKPQRCSHRSCPLYESLAALVREYR